MPLCADAKILSVSCLFYPPVSVFCKQHEYYPHGSPPLIPRPTSASMQPTGTAPAGPASPTTVPSVTTEELELTQKLLIPINADRTVQDLYPFARDATSARGVCLDAWNMVHWGFSHIWQDGGGPRQRIADEEDQLH
jgi:hypothetical protein